MGDGRTLMGVTGMEGSVLFSMTISWNPKDQTPKPKTNGTHAGRAFFCGLLVQA